MEQPPWRNGLARWTSNSKVVRSSHTGGGFSNYFAKIKENITMTNWRSFPTAVKYNAL